MSRAVLKSCGVFLHNISKIQPFLSIHTAKIPIEALITSHLSYRHMLLFSLFPSSDPFRILLQAAKIILLARCFHHVTPLCIPPLAPPSLLRQTEAACLRFQGPSRTVLSQPDISHSLYQGVDSHLQSVHAASNTHLLNFQTTTFMLSATCPTCWGGEPLQHSQTYLITHLQFPNQSSSLPWCLPKIQQPVSWGAETTAYHTDQYSLIISFHSPVCLSPSVSCLILRLSTLWGRDCLLYCFVQHLAQSGPDP